MSGTAGPAHRVSSAVEVYGFPQGHLGHLTDEEEERLKEFKALCAEKGLYKEGADDELGTHDDATLLRFLRARRFNVQDAYGQFKDTEDWRNANQLETLYETIDLEHYEETRRLYPQWTGRRDRRGIPVYVFEVKHLHSKAMAAYEKSASKTHTKARTDGKTPPKLLRLFALYENLTRFVMPLSTALTDRAHPGTPITQSNNIVDISGVGLKQFWNLRTHMQDASTLATAHYPETLDRIFIIGAPAFFPTVWGWIKRWFDPITTSKIFILSHHEMQETLRSFIDPANIPKKYGGELEFNFGDMPVLDPVLEDVTTWKNGYKDFPPGPMYWEDKGDFIELEARGSVDGHERRETIVSIRKTAKKRQEEEDEKERDEEIHPEHKSSADAEGLLRVPTVDEVMEKTATDADNHDAAYVVENGELVPADNLEPVFFVTAIDGLNTLTLKDKVNLSEDGNGAPVINTENPQIITIAAAGDGLTGEPNAEFESISKHHAEALRRKSVDSQRSKSSKSSKRSHKLKSRLMGKSHHRE